MRVVISHLKDMLSGLLLVSLGLLQELQRLGEEKRDVQRQADKDREMWELRTRELEAMVDELHLQYEDQLEQKKAELDDLQHKVGVMDKKTKANNLFLEVSMSIW